MRKLLHPALRCENFSLSPREGGTGDPDEPPLLLGFGVEGVDGAANRSKLLKDGLRTLGVR